MRTAVKYVIVALLSASFILAYVLAYVLFKDDETALYLCLSIVSMTVMAVTIIAALFLSRPSASEMYQDYVEERERDSTGRK